MFGDHCFKHSKTLDNPQQQQQQPRSVQLCACLCPRLLKRKKKGSADSITLSVAIGRHDGKGEVTELWEITALTWLAALSKRQRRNEINHTSLSSLENPVISAHLSNVKCSCYQSTVWATEDLHRGLPWTQVCEVTRSLALISNTACPLSVHCYIPQWSTSIILKVINRIPTHDGGLFNLSTAMLFQCKGMV